MVRLILNSIFMGCITFSHITNAAQPIVDYLAKPSGKYGVAFKELHWINDSICPDPNFSKKHQKDFSPGNEKYCHELMIRIYYPTPLKTYRGTPYYQPIINAEQRALKAKPSVKREDIEKLAQLKSHTVENAPIVKKVRFPVVLFISGLGGVSQLYENFITQLVSHGYIVVGINSVFINGDIVLPNNKIVSMVEAQSWDVVTKKIIPVLEQDIAFVYKKIHDTAQDVVFKSMDLKHIGAIGHSFGGRAIANVVNRHEKWFQALATLDMEVHMGSFESKSSIPPSMHIISAYWKSAFNWLDLHYRLNKSGYLVTLSPSKNDIHYSYHMNFTDFSTLQYMPAYQVSMGYDHSKLTVGEDVIIKAHGESLKLTEINRPLYLIVKNKNVWKVFYYEPGKESIIINLETIPGLQAALDNLSKTRLKEPELIPIKKIIHAHHLHFGNYLGNGDGLQITKALNLYLMDFFNTFLKDGKNPFKDCVPLTRNTVLECGPGIF